MIKYDNCKNCMSHCEQPGKPRRRNESIRRNGDINMDIEIYQLIQQVTEIARQAAQAQIRANKAASFEGGTKCI